MGPGSLAFVPRESGRMHLNAFAVLPAGIVIQTWSWLFAEELTTVGREADWQVKQVLLHRFLAILISVKNNFHQW